MIINFSVQNFGSIKDKQTLSFEADKVITPRNNVTTTGVNFYPNPLEGNTLNVQIDEFTLEADYSMTLTSLDGQVLKSVLLTKENNTISFEENKGVFILQIFKNGTLLHSDKLIKF